MGIVRPREAFRIPPPTPSICVVTRAPGEEGVGAAGGRVQLCYLFIHLRLCFFCLFVGCFFGSWLARFRQSFPACFSVFTNSSRYFLCVPSLLNCCGIRHSSSSFVLVLFSFFFLAFCSSFALSYSRFVFCFVFFPSRSRKSCGERETERGVFLHLVMDWSFVVDCEAQIMAWGRGRGESEEKGWIASGYDPRSFSVTASWSARV